MADYGMQIFDESGRIMFTSQKRILKLQGYRLISGAGVQRINLKPGQKPFYMALPLNTNIVAGRIVTLSFDYQNSNVVFSSANYQEYILYYGTY